MPSERIDAGPAAGGADSVIARVPFTYEGAVLVRPVGRGIVLLGAEGGPYLEDLPDGIYRARITFEHPVEPPTASNERSSNEPTSP